MFPEINPSQSLHSNNYLRVQVQQDLYFSENNVKAPVNIFLCHHSEERFDKLKYFIANVLCLSMSTISMAKVPEPKLFDAKFIQVSKEYQLLQYVVKPEKCDCQNSTT